MKKTIYLSLIASLFTTLVSAADLYVRDLGAGGAFTTITAAINAAADGDRIIIKPKQVGIPFFESLVINKSLTFICENNFEKYLVQGEISITPFAGRVVSIHNMQLASSNTIAINNPIADGRTILNIINSIVNQVNAAQKNCTLNISGSTTATINMNHGRITGNTITGILNVFNGVDDILSTNDIEIIANSFPTSGSGGISISQPNYLFKIHNNYMKTSINITVLRSAGTNEIFNNVIDVTGNITPIFILTNSSSSNAQLINVYNNLLYPGNNVTEIVNNGNSVVNAFYNMTVQQSSFDVIGIVNTNNNRAVNASSFTFLAGFSVVGANENAGFPTDDFIDLDLSRNDIGNRGGSNSWANYWPDAVGNKPQVNYLNTPRRINTGTATMTVNGSGYSK